MFRIMLIAEMVCCLPLGLKNIGTVFKTIDSAIERCNLQNKKG
jgi:hypothetical protein